MVLKRTCQSLVVLALAAGAGQAQTFAGPAEDAMRLLQFKAEGPRCHLRHCDLELSANNALTPHPVIGVPGDRLYVRVFRDNLAHLTMSRHLPPGQCITFSPFRVPLNSSADDKSFIFGAQMQNLLYDIDLLYDAPSQMNTVVMVFESEPGDRPGSHSSLLKLASNADVQSYFKYAIEVTFTLDHQSFARLNDQYNERRTLPTAGRWSANSPAYSPSLLASTRSMLSSMKSFFGGWIGSHPVLASPAIPPPPAVAGPPAPPVPDRPALFSNEVKVLPSAQCDTIAGYQAVNTSYTISTLTPVAELKPAPCGE